MFPEFEVCNTTISTITEVPFPGTVRFLNVLVPTWNKIDIITQIKITMYVVCTGNTGMLLCTGLV